MAQTVVQNPEVVQNSNPEAANYSHLIAQNPEAVNYSHLIAQNS